MLLQIFSVHYFASSLLGYISGLIFGYALNRQWTFSSLIKNKAKEFSLYLGVYLFSLVTGLIVLRAVVEILHIHPLVSNVFAIGVSTVLNFLGLKYFVFNTCALDLVSRISAYFTPTFWTIVGVKV